MGKNAVVLNKNVKIQDNSIKFVWGGFDITDEVIKSMNASYKDSMFDTVQSFSTTPATPVKPAAPASVPATAPAPATPPAAH